MLRSLIIGLGSMIVIALAVLAFQERHRIAWPAVEIAWPDIELPRLWDGNQEDPHFITETEFAAELGSLRKTIRSRDQHILELKSYYDDLDDRISHMQGLLKSLQTSKASSITSFDNRIRAISMQFQALKSVVEAPREDNTIDARIAAGNKRIADLEQRLEALSNRYDTSGGNTKLAGGGSSPSLKQSGSDHNSSNNGSDIGMSIDIRGTSAFGNVAYITSVNSDKFSSSYALDVGDVIIRVNDVFINSINLFQNIMSRASENKRKPINLDVIKDGEIKRVQILIR